MSARSACCSRTTWTSSSSSPRGGILSDVFSVPCGGVLGPLFAVTDGDMDVARLLQDDVATAFRARREAAQVVRLVDQDGLDLELVDIGAVVVLGIRDRRQEHLLDDDGALLRAEGEDVERLVHGQPADLVGDEPAL